jgi:hypothetical protein
VTDEQRKALITANKAFKAAWPKENLQISLNLAHDKFNVNFNIKNIVLCFTCVVAIISGSCITEKNTTVEDGKANYSYFK